MKRLNILTQIIALRLGIWMCRLQLRWNHTNRQWRNPLPNVRWPY